MIQIPADLGQRILDAARIAAAMHEQQGGIAPDRDTTVHAGGAGRTTVVIDHDGRSNPTDGTPAPSRLPRRWWRSRVR